LSYIDSRGCPPVSLEPEFPNEILVGLNLDNPQVFDVYRINLNNGAIKLDTKNLGNIVSWKANAQLKVTAAIAVTADGGYDLLYREEVNQPWQKLLNWNADDDGEIHGLSKDGKTLYIIAFGDANTRRLLAIDLKTKQETVIAEDEQYDVSSAIAHPTERHIQAVAFYKDKLRWQILDETITADFKAISSVRPGEINFVSCDLENQKWLIAYQSDNTPTYYYIYKRKSKSIALRI
jgi:dipeptidyl aminopeptidase/acylaminoacyl peptidase